MMMRRARRLKYYFPTACIYFKEASHEDLRMIESGWQIAELIFENSQTREGLITVSRVICRRPRSSIHDMCVPMFVIDF